MSRPRDRMSTAVETWEGNGRHGKGKEEEGIVVDGVDALYGSIGRLVASVDDEVDDQGVEGMRLEDPPPRRRREPQA